MPRPEKVQAVAEIKERVEAAEAVFLAEYAGLSVKEQQQMRRALRATEGEFKVVKMTLAKLAVEELGHSDLAELLTGPTGLTFADQDAAATAKALQEFAKEHTRLVIKGALLSGELIPPEKVSELAELPSRDVLLAQIAGAFQAPMAKMAGLLAAMPRNLATMVQQLIDKLPAEPAEEPAASEPADTPEADAAPEPEAAADEPAEEPDTADAPEAEADTTEDADAAEEADAAADEETEENEADEAEEEK
ncbi:MAG: 50S ribosomal protein L10 [Actinobacteria bacterium]|nr:50S ribosomal protein L10 [Actinomycetota bacterium]